MSTSTVTTMYVNSSTTVRLFGWDEHWPSAKVTVVPLLFGEMAKRASAVVANYYGDLYHDAQWLDAHVDGPTGFYWMPRYNGTQIGESVQAWERMSSGEPRELYFVELTQDRGNWYVTFTLLVKVTNDSAYL